MNVRRLALITGLSVGALVVIIFLAGFAIGTAVERNRGGLPQTSDPNLRDFLAAYNLVTRQSYFHPDRHHLVYAAIDGMLSATGDPHTLFLTPPQNVSANQRLNGAEFTGIGAIVVPDRGALRILTPLPGSPALAAGLRPDDEVIAIDGHSVVGVPGDLAISHIRGRTGTYVRLTVHRGAMHSFQVRVRRAQIPAITAYGRRFPHNVGYLAIVSFGATTADEVSRALTIAMRKPVHGLVIDLRGNPGGYVDAAQKIVSMFVTHGPVAYEQDSKKALHPLPLVSTGHVPHIPIAVLVDGQSASAAEITAAALRDNGGAVLVGSRTYGKGSMQSIYPLADGSSLRITDRLWLTPKKQSIGNVGLKPDIVVQPAGAQGAYTDPQLNAAQRYLASHG